MDLSNRTKQIIVVLIIYLIIVFFKKNYKKIKIKTIMPLSIKVFYGILLLFIGYLSISLANDYILLVLLAPLLIIVNQHRLGIGEEKIFYRLRMRSLLLNNYKVVNLQDISYPKVYKNNRYTILDFVDKNGTHRQYYPIEKYEEIKEIVFEKINISEIDSDK